MSRSVTRFTTPVIILFVGIAIGLSVRELTQLSRAEDQSTAKKQVRKLAAETPAVHDPDWERAYPQYQPVGKDLRPCPILKPGELPPQDLSGFGGRGKTS